MLSEKIITLLNEQINKELYSAYLYLDMANYYHSVNLDGYENWFFIQAQEERDHAMLMRTYLLNNDAEVVLSEIAAPNETYEDFAQPLQKTLAHEQLVTASINHIYMEAVKENDIRTMKFLDWFVTEQGEEEKNATDLIGRFELFGKDPNGLYALDLEYAARVYAAPSLVLT
ncbi:ferritin [Christensenellaceae bacterium OttesenSCG-928-L17]|nr:ferritin [Christensenellaceae bacterium OttesenSCG-928-L17]